MKRLCQSSLEQCFGSIMLCALHRYKGMEKKLRTGLAQLLLEECYSEKKKNQYCDTPPHCSFGVNVMVILSVSLGFLLELAGFRREQKINYHACKSDI